MRRTNGDLRQQYFNVLTLLVKLRQACINPAAIRTGADEDDDTYTRGHPADNAAKPAKALGSRRLTQQQREALFERYISGVAECPVCLDGVTHNVCMTACGHGPFCRECIQGALRQ